MKSYYTWLIKAVWEWVIGVNDSSEVLMYSKAVAYLGFEITGANKKDFTDVSYTSILSM